MYYHDVYIYSPRVCHFITLTEWQREDILTSANIYDELHIRLYV